MGFDLISINGKLYKPEEAKISVLDRGFLFGDAVYEVTRSYGRILFQLEPHIERLYKSAEGISMDLGLSQDEALNEIYRIYKLSNKDDRYVRVQVTRGEGPIGMATNLAEKPNWVIYVKDVDLVSDEQYKNGTSIVTTDRLRNAKKALDPNIKSGNYLNNVLAFREATTQKASEAIMVDRRGNCTEGTTSNIFRVKDGIVQTTPFEGDILVGITRAIVFDIAKKNRIPIEEKFFTPKELENSDEVFITSSTREVLPVSSVNGRKIKVGPITSKLGELYKEAIKVYCEEAKSRHPWS